MQIVIKKQNEKTHILNNLKIVTNVISSIVDDLEVKILKSDYDLASSPVISNFFYSIHSTLQSLDNSVALVNYSISNKLDILLDDNDIKFIEGTDDYCTSLNEKFKLAKDAISNYNSVVLNAPKKRGIIKTILGLD